MIEKECIVCSKKFKTHLCTAKRKFCSKECYWKNLVGRKLSPEHIATLSRVRKGHLVSLETRLKIGRANKGNFHSPETIEKIKAKRALQVFPAGHYKRISEIHKRIGVGKWMKGRKMSEETRRKWSNAQKIRYSKIPKTGMPRSLYLKIRECFEAKIWREKVFARDNFKCVLCGFDKGHIIQADHIVPFKILLLENKINSIEDAEKCEKLWDISNGRTLCTPCHKKTDTFGYGTRRMVDEYLKGNK